MTAPGPSVPSANSISAFSLGHDGTGSPYQRAAGRDSRTVIAPDATDLEARTVKREGGSLSPERRRRYARPRGGGALERRAGARCDFCRDAPRGLTSGATTTGPPKARIVHFDYATPPCRARRTLEIKRMNASGKVAEVLRLGLVEGVSVRQISRQLHVARKTVRKILGSHHAPSKPSTTPRGSLLDPYEKAIGALLDDTPEMLAHGGAPLSAAAGAARPGRSRRPRGRARDRGRRASRRRGDRRGPRPGGRRRPRRRRGRSRGRGGPAPGL